MNTLKKFAHNWLPPVIVHWISRFRDKGIYCEGEFSTWEEASAQCTGYNTEEILAKVLDATLRVKRGEAVYERDSVVFDQIEYAWPVLSGLMLAAARSGGKLNVLDFGGALGSSYFQNRKFLQLLPDVKWSVVEQEHYVEAAQLYIQDDEQLCFYKTIIECLSKNNPNVLILSSVLQYLPNPYAVLSELLSVGAGTLIIDKTSFMSEIKKEVIKIQHVPNSIYSASYPIIFFDEEYFFFFFSSSGYKLIESFKCADTLSSVATWKGYIFIKDNI